MSNNKSMVEQGSFPAVEMAANIWICQNVKTTMTISTYIMITIILGGDADSVIEIPSGWFLRQKSLADLYQGILNRIGKARFG